jgi:hypothetical protein
MDSSSLLVLLLAGAGAGTVGAMLGIGGGLVVIPVLTQLFQFQFAEARVTGLLVVIATSCGVAAATGRDRLGNLRLGIVLSIPAAFVAMLNAFLFHQTSATILYILFAGVLVLVALLMWRREPAREGASVVRAAEPGAFDGFFFDSALGADVVYRVRRVWALLGISSIAGAVSGLLGVGGGVFHVPAINLVGGVPIRAATATSNFILGVTAAASLPKYLAEGHLKPIETAAVVLGVLPGSIFLGPAIAKRIGGVALRRSFSAVVLFLAYTMLQKALR